MQKCVCIDSWRRSNTNGNRNHEKVQVKYECEIAGAYQGSDRSLQGLFQCFASVRLHHEKAEEAALQGSQTPVIPADHRAGVFADLPGGNVTFSPRRTPHS